LPNIHAGLVRVVCNREKTRETAKKAILSPVRLPFRHTGGCLTLRDPAMAVNCDGGLASSAAVRRIRLMGACLWEQCGLDAAPLKCHWALKAPFIRTREPTGRVIKIIVPLILHLPAGLGCQVLFMERDLNEVIASQTAMLRRKGPSPAFPADRLRVAFQSQVSRPSVRSTDPFSQLLQADRFAARTDPRIIEEHHFGSRHILMADRTV
jgi:hypothetical protein